MPERRAASKSCSLPSGERLPKLIRHTRRGWLAYSRFGLATTEWISHLRPFNFGVHR